jgi:uncharacterized protein (TIGR02246 family)
MNKSVRHVGACVLFALAASHPALAQGDKAVDAANATWNKAFNSGNAHALATLYDEKAVVSPGNGKSIQGRAEIEKLFKSFFDAGVHDHTIEVIQARHSGNTMYQTANWTAVAEKDGKKSQYKGVLLSVMIKGADGRWHVTAHTWNAMP